MGTASVSSGSIVHDDDILDAGLLRMAAIFSYCCRVETNATRASEFWSTNRHCSLVWVA